MLSSNPFRASMMYYYLLDEVFFYFIEQLCFRHPSFSNFRYS
nr:MAG TPA: hypothetical protein [Caudoviricetes sp.]DAW46957.1 MAG TPA: hypothetical protein [Caudoviricetes sp.]DAY34048.1 MAG TPA: hypothetical protein [Caudoviricetes sp.]